MNFGKFLEFIVFILEVAIFVMAGYSLGIGDDLAFYMFLVIGILLALIVGIMIKVNYYKELVGEDGKRK